MQIRAYQPSDWPAVEGIHDAARKDELRLAGLDDAFVPLAQAASNEGLFDYRVVVAQEDGQTAGFAAFSEDELAWLYVAPDKRRKGVGSGLIDYALSQINGDVTVEVLRGNEPALAAYRKAGFVLQETVSGQMPGNEAFRVTVHRLVFRRA